MGKKKVHKKQTDAAGNSKRIRTSFVAIVAIATLVLAGILDSTLLVVPKDTARAPTFGCNSDADCDQGQLCAAGGCIILLSSESAAVWRQDLYAMSKKVFQPMRTFGEKLLVPDRCPAPITKIVNPDESRLTLLADITVYELSHSDITIYRHLRTRGRIWIDTLRFWLGDQPAILPRSLCASAEVVSVAMGQGRRRSIKEPFVNAALRQAFPVGSVASAAISLKRGIGPVGPGGLNVLRFTLDPLSLSDKNKKTRTVLVFPLGSDLRAIEGPRPKEQRLLVGFVAYYWEHAATASRVTVRYNIPPEVKGILQIAELNP